MEVLRERYARGEISDEEFEQKRKVLQDRKK
ncbi:MAG: SHOCT domain-containing protein [Cytophagales bacterium]